MDVVVGEGTSEWVERDERERCGEMYVRLDQCLSLIEIESKRTYERK